MLSVVTRKKRCPSCILQRYTRYYSVTTASAKTIDRIQCLEKVKELEAKLNITKKEDWYKYGYEEIIANGYRSLLIPFGESVTKLLSFVYHDYEWKYWLFLKAPLGFWEDVANQRKYLDWLARQLNIKDMDGWYKVTYKDMQTRKGSRLLQLYGYSVIKVLKAVYPEHDWHPWLFNKVPAGYWNDKGNRKLCFEWMSTKLGINKWEDWYQIRTQDVVKLIDRSLMSKYGDSVIRALQDLYPEHPWEIWKFTHVPKNSYQNQEVVKNYMEFLTKELQISNPADWRQVSNDQIANLGGTSIVDRNGGLEKVLQTMYPNYFIEKSNYNPTRKSSQRWLRIILSEIFPGAEILENFLHPEMVYDLSNRRMELDLYLPAQQIAFEFQGRQHYNPSYLFGSHSKQKQRDADKKAACERMGITLIEIPYWWDRKKESLVGTLYQKVPNLVPTWESAGDPIPHDKIDKRKDKEFSSSEKLHMFMLAKNWNMDSDPKGWWMSEKFDGVRAIWDGQKLWSRLGKEIPAPKFWKEKLPPWSLDGELWINYGKFQEVCNISKVVANVERWNSVKFMVFDVPDRKEPYEDRIKFLQEASLPSNAPLIRPIKCENVEHLESYHNEVIERGGEGLMLRKPNSSYASGRSNAMRKCKKFDDTEVKFLYIHESSKGLVCQQLNDHVCIVQCPPQMYSNPPPHGAVITVKHTGTWDSGKLKYPTFFRERADMTWEDCLKGTKRL